MAHVHSSILSQPTKYFAQYMQDFLVQPGETLQINLLATDQVNNSREAIWSREAPATAPVSWFQHMHALPIPIHATLLSWFQLLSPISWFRKCTHNSLVPHHHHHHVMLSVEFGRPFWHEWDVPLYDSQCWESDWHSGHDEHS